MSRFIIEFVFTWDKFVMEAKSRTTQGPSQDLGLSKAEIGLRRILQDCRTFGGPGKYIIFGKVYIF